ncbi:hypothetical protein, partial [Aeromonas allosaccharophila]|uniref:hypothetical protein n=1 Tax=Aeromonas allosaccharophila TaxID=656 RepID=UPI002B48511F
PKPNQQVSDFYTSAGSVNGSLTDRHYGKAPLLALGEQLEYKKINFHKNNGFIAWQRPSSAHLGTILAVRFWGMRSSLKGS